MHIDFLSPESARSAVRIVADGKGQNMVTESKMTSKWIGSDCSKKHQ